MKVEKNVVLLLAVLSFFALATLFVPGWEGKILMGVTAVGVAVYLQYYMKTHEIGWIRSQVVELLRDDGYSCKEELGKDRITVDHQYGELVIDLFNTRYRLKRMYVLIRFVNEEMDRLPDEVRNGLLNMINTHLLVSKVWYDEGVVYAMYGADAETAEDVVWAYKYGLDRMHESIDELMKWVYKYWKDFPKEDHRVGFKMNGQEDDSSESDK